jgi:hypothetical protein
LAGWTRVDFRGFSLVRSTFVSGIAGGRSWDTQFVFLLRFLGHLGGLQLLSPEFAIEPKAETGPVSGTGWSGRTNPPREGLASASNTGRRMTRVMEWLRGEFNGMKSL